MKWIVSECRVSSVEKNLLKIEFSCIYIYIHTYIHIYVHTGSKMADPCYWKIVSGEDYCILDLIEVRRKFKILHFRGWTL